MMNEYVLPFVYIIIKLRLSITNGNHGAMHTMKQLFPINYDATILEFIDLF